MESEPRTLRDAFVEAYPVYLAKVLTLRGIEMLEVIADAIVEGASVLDGLLSTLEALPFDEQWQSPLELFREALRPVGRALDTAGVPSPEMERGSVSIVAWDNHRLSPASSAELGPAAHEAHLRWGVAKARAMSSAVVQERRPSLGVWCSSHDSQTIKDQAKSAGYATSDRPKDASYAIVDLDAGASASALDDALQAGGRTIVYGSAIDDLQQAALRVRGVWKIIGRERALTDLGAVLPIIT
jgi:hypothetical protein